MALKFAILASGTGTNARALMEHAAKHPERLKATCVVSDRAEAPVLKVAEELGVPSYMVPAKNEGALLAVLKKHGAEWACLAGYKKLVGKGFLEFFHDPSLGFSRVMNVHPSLLPAYPGLGGYERAFKDGVKLSGVTVHLVDEGLDTGLAILQEAFEREESDSLASFEAKARKIEHKLFCKALDLASRGKIRMAEKDGARFVSVGA